VVTMHWLKSLADCTAQQCDCTSCMSCDHAIMRCEGACKQWIDSGAHAISIRRGSYDIVTGVFGEGKVVGGCKRDCLCIRGGTSDCSL
jgi:hypothetical protein